MPPWAALVVGLVAGLVFPFMLFVAEVTLRLKDHAAIVALGLTGGLWGVVSVALFADARSGVGWNGVDMQRGVAGLFSQGESQLVAQLMGLLAIGAWGLLWGLLLGGISRLRIPRHSHVVETTDHGEDVTSPAVEIAGSDALAEAMHEDVVPEAVNLGTELPPATDEMARRLLGEEDAPSVEA